jgi:chromosome segregation protein
VTIQFDEIITGIVGPNGCGKSNVLDAIRWVMGEQSVKSLRGRKRLDVIFNGSERRKGAPSAEVTLVLEDVPVEHRPQGFEDCSEIAITRKLSKRGTSTYLLNKQPARLRDIKMLFMGTGLGKHSYALIEQGKVNSFIQSSPEQRRFWIEEAAGISRYKEQRKLAESRLGQTQSHVDRLNDVLGTLSTQRKSLQRQASKARKHRTLSTEIEDLDLYLSAHRYLKLWARDRQLGLLLNKLGSKEESLRDTLAKKELEAQGLEMDLKEASGELIELRESLQKHISRLALVEQTKEHLKEDIQRLEKRLKHVKQEQGDSENQMGNADEVTATLLQELKDIRAEQGEHGEELEEADERLQQLQEQLQSAEREIQSIKSEVIEAVRQVATHRNQLTGIEKRREDLQARRDQHEQETQKLEEEESTLQTQVDQTSRILERCQYERDYIEGKQEQLADSFVNTKQDLQVARESYREIQEQLSEKQARFESLEELQSEYGDLSEASRALLQARDKGEISNKMAMRGALVEILEVPEQFEQAVASVLSDKLQYLVVRNAEEAVGAIQYLNDNQLGRAGFLTMDARPLHEPITPPEHASVFGCLADLINTQPIFRPLVEQLLGNCVVVREIEDAMYIKAEQTIPVPATYVSLDGVVMFADGTIVGGHAVSQSVGVLQRRRQIKELAATIEQLELLYDEKEEAVEELQDQLEELEEQQEAQRNEMQQLTIKETALSKDLQRFESDLSRLRERSSLIRREDGRIQLQMEGFDKETEQLERRLQELVLQQESAEDKLASTQRQVETDRANQQELIEELTELKVKMAARREREESLQQQLRQIQEKKNNLEAYRKKLRDELIKLEEDLITKRQNLENASEERIELGKTIEEQKEQVAEQGSEFAGDEEKLRELRSAIELTRTNIEKNREKRTELLLEQRENQVNQQALDQETRQQYGIPIGEALPGQHCRPTPGPEHKKQLVDLKQQRSRLGEVNPLAEEEFYQIDEKYQFLRTQIEDLEKTIASLNRTIKQINTKTKEQFRETFEAIRGHFSSLFPKLFEGGAANLILTDPDNLLETGVDIMVRPPGKRRQNIMLLSGGEKALTTTALIFSFFLYKPSPFCILDEVDAPLDDVNIDRYNRLLRELSGVTQFIVITHNKRTMELSDQLYGVTMQEPGVSTVVTVRIEDGMTGAAA